ncbi:MAG: thiamine phosphate synthase [Methanobacteriaceae archaeon]|jgi:thiamine-phosphate pyrophosphorylase|nr:thiamine phosphate synthase [Candidatus Methanorudis spinitermitis]
MKNKVDYSLYLVTNSNNKTNEEFLKIIEESILGGATIVQTREKAISTRDFYNLAIEVKKITDSYDIPLIVNDRIDVAIAIDADGVHVGQNDLPADIVRTIIGDDKILGVSAATVEEAKKAEKDGADYIGSGAMYPTETKKSTCISMDYLKKIVDGVNIPIVAIGGLNENNIDSKLINTGIKGISIVSAIMNSNNPKIASELLKKKFHHMN